MLLMLIPIGRSLTCLFYRRLLSAWLPVNSLSFTQFLDQHRLMPTLQSGFRPGHSTETATLRVLSDLLAAVDRGDFAALVLLDLSAAFDTIDHHILLERLRRSYRITDSACNWLASYLTGRTQCVRRRTTSSRSTTLSCGVPQGSVLGPLLFVL
jgi:Reverse transcriptase (RNA-dependent DNA polymerase)